MMRRLSILLLLAVAWPAVAEDSGNGKLVFDAAFTSGQFSSARTMENVRFGFSKVSIDDQGRAVVSKKRKFGSNQYFARPAKLAIYESLKLDTGKYVLSSITFRFEGRSRRYCFPFQTILFEIESGKTSYLGQLHMQAPNTSPNGAESFTILDGISRNLVASMANDYWRFDEASLSMFSTIEVANPDVQCSNGYHRVQLWSGELDTERPTLKTTRNKKRPRGKESSR